MFSFKMLLSALTLTLLAVSVESGGDFFFNPPFWDLDRIPKDVDINYDSPVLHADRMVRPVRSLKSAYGPISHSGVRVTLEDGSQWLIHKRNSNGVDSPMVVTSTENMSSKWKSVETREFNGTKTVADFVKAGGDAYDLRRANCHHATDAMMNQ